MDARRNNLTHETKIWFGKYKGKKLKDIPDDYFKYLLESKISFKGIKHYTKVYRNINC
jgi:uncharacterized protein (DUF3820 family)